MKLDYKFKATEAAKLTAQNKRLKEPTKILIAMIMGAAISGVQKFVTLVPSVHYSLISHRLKNLGYKVKVVSTATSSIVVEISW